MGGQLGPHYPEWIVPGPTGEKSGCVLTGYLPRIEVERKLDWLKMVFHNEPLFSWLYAFRMADPSGRDV